MQSLALHPGVATTGIGRHLLAGLPPLAQRLGELAAAPFFKSAAEAAEGVLHAALAPELAGVGGVRPRTSTAVQCYWPGGGPAHSEGVWANRQVYLRQGRAPQVYLSECALAPTSPAVAHVEHAARLWALSAELVGLDPAALLF